MRDEVLARLLELNAERARAGAAGGMKKPGAADKRGRKRAKSTTNAAAGNLLAQDGEAE